MSVFCSFFMLLLIPLIPWELENYEILSFHFHLLTRIFLYGSAPCHLLFSYPILQFM